MLYVAISITFWTAGKTRTSQFENWEFTFKEPNRAKYTLFSEGMVKTRQSGKNKGCKTLKCLKQT